MKLQLLEVSENVSKKTGLVSYSAIGLGKFSNYGKIQSRTVELKLDELQYKELQKNENKIIDFDFVIPLPTFPLPVTSYKL